MRTLKFKKLTLRKMRKLFKICCKRTVVTEVTTIFTPMTMINALLHTAEANLLYGQEFISKIASASNGWKILDIFENTDGVFIGSMIYRNTTPHTVVFKSFDRFTGVHREAHYFNEVLEPNSTKVVNFAVPMVIVRMGANHTLGYLIEVYSDATLTELTPITQGLVEAIFCVVQDPNVF